MNWNEVTNERFPRLYAAWRNQRGRINLSLYRSRNAPDELSIRRAFSFLHHAPNNPQTSYITTISVPRGVDDVAEAVQRTYYNVMAVPGTRVQTDVVIVNTINNKEIGDLLEKKIVEDNSEALTTLEYFIPTLTQSPYHRVSFIKVACESEYGQFPRYILFTNKLDQDLFNRLAGCICTDLNVYGNDTVTVANYIINVQLEPYEAYLDTIATALEDAERMRELDETLERISNSVKTIQKNTTQRLIDDATSRINDLQTRLEQQLQQLRRNQLQLIGIDSSVTTDEVKEFLNSVKHSLNFMRVQGDYLYLRYQTPLLYWDEDIFNTLRNANNTNVMHRRQSRTEQRVIDGLFKDKTHQLIINDDIYLDLSCSHGRVFGYSRLEDNFSSVPALKGMPNPHHRHFNCWGDNESFIRDGFYNGKYIEAFAQLFAAVAGINLADGVVMGHFRDDLFGTRYDNTPCILEKETKRVMTLREYKTYCEQKEEATDETHPSN